MKNLKNTFLILLSASIVFSSLTLAQSRSINTQPNKFGKKEIYDRTSISSSNKSIASDFIKTNKNFKRDYLDNYDREDQRDLTRRETKKNISRDRYNNGRTDRYERSSENYFRIDRSGRTLWDGKHWAASDFPVKVYVQESRSRHYKSEYKNYVKYALDVWRKADDRINYKLVKSIDDADIAVIFVENLGDMYQENYLGLTNYDTDRDNKIEFSKIEISLIKNGNEKISAGEIKATIIHEFGHAFGLGHSDNELDLMYPYISSNHSPEMTYDELSTGDKLAIKDVISLAYDKQYVWR